jgi:hypothetical protein
MPSDEFSMDWEVIRRVLKYDGAALHTNGVRFWLAVPISPKLAPHIIAHPAIVSDDWPQPAARQSYRWRTHSPSARILAKGDAR